MTDLNSTLFFKGKLQIRRKTENVDLLWLLVQKIKNWMVPKWRRSGEPISGELAQWSTWKYGGEIVSENGIVRFRSVYHQPMI